MHGNHGTISQEEEEAIRASRQPPTSMFRKWSSDSRCYRVYYMVQWKWGNILAGWMDGPWWLTGCETHACGVETRMEPIPYQFFGRWSPSVWGTRTRNMWICDGEKLEGRWMESKKRVAPTRAHARFPSFFSAIGDHRIFLHSICKSFSFRTN